MKSWKKLGGNTMKKINHIAIAVNNIEEAAKFYQDVLGLDLSRHRGGCCSKDKGWFF